MHAFEAAEKNGRADDSLRRSDQDARAAELPDAPSHAPTLRPRAPQTSVINAIRAHMVELSIVASRSFSGEIYPSYQLGSEL